jgi:serine/threonine protein kinase
MFAQAEIPAHNPAATRFGFQVVTAWPMHLSIPVDSIDAESPAFAGGSLIADKYVVERTLGSGGLAVVVVARHRELGHRVAIKYLREQCRTISGVVDRFRCEAHIAALIRSEHVVRVQDVGEVAGAPFIVMEYLEGRDLGHVIRDGDVTTAQAVDYVLQACEGLAEIHSIGIIHRDLKPENLFVVQDCCGPVVKVIDFGVSKVTPTQDNGGWAHVTYEEALFGTPLYMSPEQLGIGGVVDCRTDIWALGVVLFELLTRGFPFHGEDNPHLFANILTTAPSRPSATAPGIPAELEAAILRCLEKDASRRFQNVAELADRIAPFGPRDAQDRVRRIKTTLALLAPPPPHPQPMIVIRRPWMARRRARVLASVGAAMLALCSLLLVGRREERAGAAVPPVGVVLRATALPPILAPPVASVQPTRAAAEAAEQTASSLPRPAAARSPLPRSRPHVAVDRRALYGARK